MALLKAYFDDSGDEHDPQHNCVVLAGYVGTAEAWTSFEERWQIALNRHGIPWSHMKLMAHFRPPFHKWRENEQARADCLKDLIGAIASCDLKAFGSLVRLPDLRRFNAEKSLGLDAMTVALYACLIELHQKYGERGERIELTLDKIKKAHSVIDLAERYAETDTFYPGCGKNIEIRALKGDAVSFKNVLPMQAADLGAYELKKFHETNNDWYSVASQKADRSNLYWDMILHQLRRDNYVELPHGNRRKSLNALSRAAYFEGAIWSYATLTAADTARNGVWPSSQEQSS